MDQLLYCELCPFRTSSPLQFYKHSMNYKRYPAFIEKNVSRVLDNFRKLSNLTGYTVLDILSYPSIVENFDARRIQLKRGDAVPMELKYSCELNNGQSFHGAKLCPHYNQQARLHMERMMNGGSVFTSVTPNFASNPAPIQFLPGQALMSSQPATMWTSKNSPGRSSSSTPASFMIKDILTSEKSGFSQGNSLPPPVIDLSQGQMITLIDSGVACQPTGALAVPQPSVVSAQSVFTKELETLRKAKNFQDNLNSWAPYLNVPTMKAGPLIQELANFLIELKARAQEQARKQIVAKPRTRKRRSGKEDPNLPGPSGLQFPRSAPSME